MTEPCSEVFKRYRPSVFDLIPLHMPDAVSTKRGVTRKDGKRPLHGAWTVTRYSTKAVLAEQANSGRNIGVRLKADQLIIDVDPRNGGTPAFEELCAELEIDPLRFPKVTTGSGGAHYYMTKPEDVPVRDSLECFPGVEYKSKGRQVVAAGSVHPDTGALYVWDDAHPRIEDGLPPAPEKLLKAIVRPQRSSGIGGGTMSQHQLSQALEQLDPTEFAQHDKWLQLMMSCHHATNGDGRSEFIEWSTLDSQYANDAEIIGRRWDSLAADKPEGVTVATLNKILRDHDAAGFQAPTIDAADDFDEDYMADDFDFEKPTKPTVDEDDGLKAGDGIDEESFSWLQELNNKYTVVMEGGKFVIVSMERHEDGFDRDVWVRTKATDFTLLHGNKRVTRDKEALGLNKNASDTVPLGKFWLEWPGRKDAKGIGFFPNKERPGYINMWQGFAVEPSGRGTWKHLREMIHEVLANGNDLIDEYIVNWCAFLFQHPEKRAESALVFKGGMGVGKGTLGNTLAKIIGRHALAIQSPELIVGRFNAHLQDTIFLFADEAVRPYDRIAESRLKALITEPRLSYEGKGRDVLQAQNFLHIMMASNEQWVIPAGLDDRRFLVSEANTKWQGRRDKWEKLYTELENGGYGRMLLDLGSRHKLPAGWHPRHIPSTNALIDQKIRNMKPIWQFFFNACVEGVLPFEVIDGWGGPWEKAAVRFFYYDFRGAFRQFCNDNGIKPGGMHKSSMFFVKKDLRELFAGCNPDLRANVPEERTDLECQKSDNRSPAVQIPSLAECRGEFERRLNGHVNWESSDAATDEEFN
jgi:hypothetical protein